MTDISTQLTITEKFNKTKVALRYFLIGRGYFTALEALEFATKYHTGKRKNGITPEFYHQLSIASYVRTLPLPIEDMEAVLAAVLLHDVVEDYDVTIEEIEARFGQRVSKLVALMTNKMNDAKLSKEVYYANLATDPLGAILKGSDRINNIQTMGGVFSDEKQIRYIDEVKNYILPMLKKARRAFPVYEAVIENIKFVLTSQIELIEAALSGKVTQPVNNT